MNALGDRCEGYCFQVLPFSQGNRKQVLQMEERMGKKGERLAERTKHEIHIGKISQWTREMT